MKEYTYNAFAILCGGIVVLFVILGFQYGALGQNVHDMTGVGNGTMTTVSVPEQVPDP